MEEFEDHIEVGDKVLIAGLYGDEFRYINNKIAIVKEISVTSNHNSDHYVAKLIIDGIFIVPIGLEFLYKIDKPSIDISQFIVSMDNPFIYYVRKKNIVDTTSTVMMDEYGQIVTMVKTRDNKTEILLVMGVN